jgi:hypothetical protein
MVDPTGSNGHHHNRYCHFPQTFCRKILLDNWNTPGVYIFAAAMTPLSKLWRYHQRHHQGIGLTKIDGNVALKRQRCHHDKKNID